MNQTFSVGGLLDDKNPVVRTIYDRLLKQLRTLGSVGEEPKKTSIHLTNGTAFAGVHPQKGAINLNIRSDKPIASPRVTKAEQVSKNRWHQNVKLTSPDDVDAELMGWLTEAYRLSTPQ